MHKPPLTAGQVARSGRCPVCAEGRIFSGMLEIQPVCTECGFALSEHDNGDGPAYMAILIVGALVTTLASIVEFAYMPPYWLHVVVWVPMILGLSYACLRFFRAYLIGLQYELRSTASPIAQQEVAVFEHEGDKPQGEHHV